MIEQHNGKIVGFNGSLVNFMTGKGPVIPVGPIVDPLPGAKYLTYFNLSGFENKGTCTDQPEINTSDPDYPIFCDKWYPGYYYDYSIYGTTVRTINDGSVLDGCKEIYTKNQNINGTGYRSSELSCRYIPNGVVKVPSVSYHTGTINIRVKITGPGSDYTSQEYNSFVTNGAVYLGGIRFEFQRYRGLSGIDPSKSELWIYPIIAEDIDTIELFDGATFEENRVKYHKNMYGSWITLGATVRDGYKMIYVEGKLIARVKYKSTRLDYAYLSEQVELIAPSTWSSGKEAAEATELYLSDQDLSSGHGMTLNWPRQPLIKP